jgi:hypothetical protein
MCIVANASGIKRPQHATRECSSWSCIAEPSALVELVGPDPYYIPHDGK